MDYQSITLDPSAGETLTLDDQISDQSGSDPADNEVYGAGRGSLILNGAGTVVLGATNDFTGGVTLEAGTLQLAAVSAAGTGHIVFAALTDPTLAFSPADLPSNPISGLGAGDFIQITGETVTGTHYVGTPSGGTLEIDFAGGSVDLNILGSYTQGSFAVQNGEVAVSCFAAGSRILTDRGEIAVEALREGDRVIAWTDGARRECPVRWIGRRVVEPALHPCPRDVAPVRIARGAFGPGAPHRDLYLSPDHAVFVDNVLIPVKYLIHDPAIVQIDVARVIYFHIELDRHEVLLAEGLLVESLLPGSDRSAFDGQGAARRPHHDFHSLNWEARGRAPLVVTGPGLAAARQRLRHGGALATT